MVFIWFVCNSGKVLVFKLLFMVGDDKTENCLLLLEWELLSGTDDQRVFFFFFYFYRLKEGDEAFQPVLCELLSSIRDFF